jgi:ParB-like nuclease domain
MIRLVPIGDVRPSTYNPRKADPRRLDLLELSLRKLGFVLPLFADAEGELLSGHQRHHVAGRMGLTHVPVAFLPPMDLAKRKAVNIAFNRGTNDLARKDTPTDMTAALARARLDEAAAKVPDRDPAAPGFNRCLDAEARPIGPLLEANAGRWVDYARNMARLLAADGVRMPVVCTPDLKVVNGIGRLQLAAERGEGSIPVVLVGDEEQALADAVLNLLSMDFDIHGRYEDLLRYNSFRRARRVRAELGQGFIFTVAKGSTSKGFDVTVPAAAARWKKAHGTSVVDFGAGHLHETEILRSIGVRVSPFEPFRLGADGQTIDKAASVALNRAFLVDVRGKVRWDSVFISSVLNSVPFAADRRAIATVCAALCGPRTRLYAVATAVNHTNWKEATGYSQLNKDQSTRNIFKLEYEPGITLGEFSDKPKVQKYHSQAEFYGLFKPLFGTVQVSETNQNVTAVCATALPPDPSRLGEALDFEFDLPYPDGSRMGLAAEARAAFSERLGIKL